MRGSVPEPLFVPVLGVQGELSQEVSNMLQTVFGWCLSHGGRSHDSIPVGRVHKSVDAVSRAFGLKC